MQLYWTNFAKSGAPGGDRAAEWPEYTAGAPQQFVLDVGACAATPIVRTPMYDILDIHLRQLLDGSAKLRGGPAPRL